MKNMCKLLILSALLLCHSYVSAAIPIHTPIPESFSVEQSKITVKGLVVDKVTGESLPSVAIMIKGKSTGTITDVDGRFSIDVPDRNAILVFTYISYKSKEVSVAKQ